MADRLQLGFNGQMTLLGNCILLLVFWFLTNPYPSILNILYHVKAKTGPQSFMLNKDQLKCSRPQLVNTL